MSGVTSVMQEVTRLIAENERYGLLSELARGVGVTPTTTGKWAEGALPSEEWWPDIAEFFGLPRSHFTDVFEGRVEVGAVAATAAPEGRTSRRARRVRPRAEAALQAAASELQSETRLWEKTTSRINDLEAEVKLLRVDAGKAEALRKQMKRLAGQVDQLVAETRRLGGVIESLEQQDRRRGSGSAS